MFPALTLGLAAGALSAIVLPGLELTPAIVAGVAAAAAAILRMPFFGALAASLLAGPAAFDTMPIAVLAATVGWLVASAADARLYASSEPARPTADSGAVSPAQSPGE